jgi:hypothetical protein
MRTSSQPIALFLIGVLPVVPALAADVREAHVADQTAIQRPINERLSEDDADRDFLEAWAVTDCWTLLVVPTEDEADTLADISYLLDIEEAVTTGEHACGKRIKL